MSFIGNEPEDRMWFYTFGFLILIVIVATTLLICLVNEDIKANNICKDNNWDRAEKISKPNLFDKYTIYICQKQNNSNKWATEYINSTNTFEIRKYKTNPGKIE